MSPIEKVPTKDLPPSNSLPKGVEQAGTIEKEKEKPKGVALEIMKPSAAPKDSFEGGVVS